MATMSTTINITELVFCGVFGVIGLTGNTFILTAILTKWIKGLNEMSASNIINASLAATNICLQCETFAGTVCYVYWKEVFFLEEALKISIGVNFCLCGSSLWLTTWLCIYYCLKIVNCNHPWFIRLKERFPKIVPWLLVGSTLVSFTISMTRAFTFHYKSIVNQAFNNSEKASSNVSRDGTMSDMISGHGPSTLFIIQVLFPSMAFLMISVSAVAIIASLHKHMQRMAQSADGFRNPNLKAHLGALKTVTMLLVLNLGFYVAQVLIHVELDFCVISGYITSRILTFLFPALNSLIIILGNLTMKNTFVKIIYESSCCKQEVA